MESKNPLISVVVPVYNVEDYLERCVESILNQTYRNLEIFLVDDGSPDGCGALCDQFARKDSRIKVIHKSNGGLSDARNVAIDVATGDYLGFVDSDDFIHPTMYASLLNALLTNDADISICYYRSFSPGDSCFENDEHPPLVALDKLQALDRFFSYNAVNFTLVWNKLYKRSLFEGIRYPKGKTREDEFTTYKLVYKADKVVFLKDHLYFYLLRPGSIMREKSFANELNYADAQAERQDFFRTHQLWELSAKAIRKYLLWLCAMEYKYGKEGLAKPFLQELDHRKKEQIAAFLKESKPTFLPKVFFRFHEMFRSLTALLAFRRIYRNDGFSGFLLGDPLQKNDL